MWELHALSHVLTCQSVIPRLAKPLDRPGTLGALFVHPRGELMKLITCVIRPERVAAVKESLFRAGVTGITLSHVTGHGGEREVVEQYRGSSLVLEFHDKVRIEMACSEPFVEATIQAIVDAARTGEV